VPTTITIPIALKVFPKPNIKDRRQSYLDPFQIVVHIICPQIVMLKTDEILF